MAFMLMIIVLFSFILKDTGGSLSISCGASESGTLSSGSHIYSFTISERQDVTFDLCDSRNYRMWFSQLDLYDHRNQHLMECSGTLDPIQKKTDSITAICDGCFASIYEASMTLKGLNPGSYYIEVSNTYSSGSTPTYILNMDCEPPVTTSSPTTSKATLISDDNESGGSTIFIIGALIIVLFVAGMCLRYIKRSNKTDRCDDESNAQRNVCALSAVNMPVPSVPVIDEKVSLMVSISDDEEEGLGRNVAPGAEVDDIAQQEGIVDSAYDDIVSFFYDKVNIDGYNDIYIGLLIENGFHTLDMLKSVTDHNLKAIGIDKSDHRQKIISEISNI